MTTYAVIMAGGAGTRFWPLSRRLRPKQLLSLLTERSLLVETVTRIAPAAVPFEQTLIVTGSHLADAIESQVVPLGVEVVVEPMARHWPPARPHRAPQPCDERHRRGRGSEAHSPPGWHAPMRLAPPPCVLPRTVLRWTW